MVMGHQGAVPPSPDPAQPSRKESPRLALDPLILELSVMKIIPGT